MRAQLSRPPAAARPHAAALRAAVAAAVLLCVAGAAKPAPEPPTPLAVRAEGVIVTGAARGKVKNRYALTLPEKGTLIVSLQPIQGALPRASLRNADGKIIRRERDGQLWTRATPGEPLTLEVYARADDAPGVYQLRAVFDVDRPREQRHLQRPARPGDVVIVSKGGQRVERVVVDGIQAEFKDRGPDALVTIPAFARRGVIEMFGEGTRARVVELALIGAEPATPDLAGDACAGADALGCIELTLSPAVGSAWLMEIARVVDADVVVHTQKTGAVLLKLRLPASESFALATLAAMPGVRAARRASPHAAP